MAALWYMLSILLLFISNQDVLTWIEKCKSQNSGKVSIAISALKSYDQDEFNDEARSELGMLIDDRSRHLDDLIMVAGWLGLIEEIEAYENSKERHPQKIYQRLQIAKLRAGNLAKLDNFLKNVKKVPINDDFNYTIAPLVVYTRQKKAIDYVLEVIMMRNSACSPADAESYGRIDCAYRLVEMIAPVIDEFPYELTKSGDIKTSNYESMLEEVRTWIDSNKNSYSINNKGY